MCAVRQAWPIPPAKTRMAHAQSRRTTLKDDAQGRRGWFRAAAFRTRRSYSNSSKIARGQQWRWRDGGRRRDQGCRSKRTTPAKYRDRPTGNWAIARQPTRHPSLRTFRPINAPNPQRRFHDDHRIRAVVPTSQRQRFGQCLRRFEEGRIRNASSGTTQS
jgi:hypothetical protein